LQLKGLKSGHPLVVTLTFRFVQRWPIGNMIGCIKDFKSLHGLSKGLAQINQHQIPFCFKFVENKY
jgi:hypothetical protein